MSYDKKKAIRLYERQEFLSRKRDENIREVMAPFLQSSESHGLLISRITLILGHSIPKSNHDRIQRDLLADVFDNLYESTQILMRGKTAVAFPIARRAFESLTLKIAFHLEPPLCDKWIKGKQIGNSEVRNILNKHKDVGGEPLETTKKLYNYFSQDSHPNYFYIPNRSLGEGNQYVLGSIGMPLLYVVCILFQHILEMWHWFCTYEAYNNMELIKLADKEFLRDFKKTSKHYRDTHKLLTKALKSLHGELMDEKMKEKKNTNGLQH